MTRLRSPADLGRAIRARRESLGLTQAAAAARSGVSTRLWSEIERGARPNASLASVLGMLQLLGLDLTLATREGIGAHGDRQ
jgi:transcriptional regulator with XRE-family HTH domain